MLDLKIAGGLIVDGTGRPGLHGDIDVALRRVARTGAGSRSRSVAPSDLPPVVDLAYPEGPLRSGWIVCPGIVCASIQALSAARPLGEAGEAICSCGAGSLSRSRSRPASASRVRSRSLVSRLSRKLTKATAGMA
jgi:hypothetical protein